MVIRGMGQNEIVVDGEMALIYNYHEGNRGAYNGGMDDGEK